MRFKLVKTRESPEQYDVFNGEERVGRLRLRYGTYTVECGSAEVLSTRPSGFDQFEKDERDYYLNEGCRAIKEHLEKQPKPKDLLFEVG